MNKKEDINEKQDECKTNKYLKTHLHHNDKIKQEIDYFIAGLDMEVHRVANALNLVMYSQEFGASKQYFLCRSKMMQSHIWHSLGTQYMHFKSHSKRAVKTTRTPNTGTTGCG